MIHGPAHYKKTGTALPPFPSLFLHRLRYIGWRTSQVGGCLPPQIPLIPLPWALPPAIATTRQSRKHRIDKRSLLVRLISSEMVYSPVIQQFPHYNTMSGGQTMQTPGMSGYQRNDDRMLPVVENSGGMPHSPLDGHGIHHRYQEMRGGQRFRNPMLSGPGGPHQYDDPFFQPTNSPSLAHRSTPSSLGPSSGASRRSSVSLENDIGGMETVMREIAALRHNHQKRIEELTEQNDTLTEHIVEIREAIKRLEEKYGTGAETSKTSKSIANLHKVAKVSELYKIKMTLTFLIAKDTVHTMFWNMCNVDQTLGVEAITPHENGEACVVVQVDGKDTEVWRPNCGLAIDAAVNRKFIQGIVNRVMDNERVSILR